MARNSNALLFATKHLIFMSIENNTSEKSSNLILPTPLNLQCSQYVHFGGPGCLCSLPRPVCRGKPSALQVLLHSAVLGGAARGRGAPEADINPVDDPTLTSITTPTLTSTLSFTSDYSPV